MIILYIYKLDWRDDVIPEYNIKYIVNIRLYIYLPYGISLSRDPGTLYTIIIHKQDWARG